MGGRYFFLCAVRLVEKSPPQEQLNLPEHGRGKSVHPHHEVAVVIILHAEQTVDSRTEEGRVESHNQTDVRQAHKQVILPEGKHWVSVDLAPDSYPCLCRDWRYIILPYSAYRSRSNSLPLKRRYYYRPSTFHSLFEGLSRDLHGVPIELLLIPPHRPTGVLLTLTTASGHLFSKISTAWTRWESSTR